MGGRLAPKELLFYHPPISLGHSILLSIINVSSHLSDNHATDPHHYLDNPSVANWVSNILPEEVDYQQPHPSRDGPDEAFPDEGVEQAEIDGFAEQDADHDELGGEDEEQEDEEVGACPGG